MTNWMFCISPQKWNTKACTLSSFFDYFPVTYGKRIRFSVDCKTDRKNKPMSIMHYEVFATFLSIYFLVSRRMQLSMNILFLLLSFQITISSYISKCSQNTLLISNNSYTTGTLTISYLLAFIFILCLSINYHKNTTLFEVLL